MRVLGVGLVFMSLVIAAEPNHATWALAGTIVTNKGSTAVFRSEQGEEQRLALGARLAGCTLQRIEARRVRFICGNGTRVMALENGQRINPTTKQPGSYPAAQPLISLKRAWLYALARDPQRLVSEISFVPVVNNGWLYGYRVSRISETSELADLGLHNGDVIKSVNGVPASQPQSFVRMLNSLAKVSIITLEVQRKGEPVTIHYVLD